MIFPTVHLNGTSKAGLMEQYQRALEALRQAELALSDASPHARDYYIKGANAENQAITEHQARMRKIEEISAEIEAIVMNIFEQGR